jgi:hypothetical protein
LRRELIGENAIRALRSRAPESQVESAPLRGGNSENGVPGEAR